MARMGHLGIIALIGAVGCYLFYLDAQQIRAGLPFPYAGIYGAISFVISALLLFIDFRRLAGGADAVT